MSDHDRDPDSRVHETERTTIIHTGERRRGSGGVVGLVVALLLVVLFVAFGRGLVHGVRDGGVNVSMAAPNVRVPKVPAINVKLPDVKVDVPRIDVKTEDGAGNRSSAK